MKLRDICMIWSGTMLKLTNLVCVGASIFRNQKIKNGLKSFFLRKENGESFSFVQSIPFFVQNDGYSHIHLPNFNIRSRFLLIYPAFLYKAYVETIAYVLCNIRYMFGLLAYCLCKIAYNLCIFGDDLCSIMN